MLVEIPAAAAATVPHRPSQPALQLLVEPVLRLAGGGQRLHAHPVAFRDRIGHVMDLRFDHEHHGVVSQPSVRPQQEEQVGHVGDGDPAVCTDALTVPAVDQVLAVTPLDLHIGIGVGDVEAGGVHDHIGFPEDLTASAVGGDDPVVRDPVDAVGDQFGLRVRHRGVIGRGVQDPFAADAIPRRQLAPQLAILHRSTNIVFGIGLDDLQRVGPLGHAVGQRLLGPVDAEAQQCP
ncbi:Uncharacterised protein [Mycobacterium tuberculosis]|uniref:Uncharacterized protein n=1 Tax=Mycobacterium tuberculosis TaxID=1773 RepID=A0A655EXV9_MYCTX|nr:Uncharacterised protein [Mycobacterium tuberculosis]CKQ83996.1 Uncharacterised protein [Mycobacterium tuberculosis]CKU81405.1 Uncharacterised protein [Mycobacterium tuberculosis]CNV36851.1 Uncharacterised protein [Mycobacterium tuberculosis]CNV67259.1 Uncharacterised protein [Mycobacterium tuberculosis]